MNNIQNISKIDILKEKVKYYQVHVLIQMYLVALKVHYLILHQKELEYHKDWR